MIMLTLWMQGVWQELAMVSSLVSKRHCRGRSSATRPGGTTERHQQDWANPENMMKYNYRSATCGMLRLKSSELQRAIQQSGALWITPSETSRYEVQNLQVCFCLCVWTVCIDVKLRGGAGHHSTILYIIHLSRGSRGPGGSVTNEDTPRGPCKRTCGTVVVHLDAFKSQLVATIVPYIYI